MRIVYEHFALARNWDSSVQFQLDLLERVPWSGADDLRNLLHELAKIGGFLHVVIRAKVK